jgi:hypothetical protein
MSRQANPFAFLPIELELQREKASALRYAGEKLETLLHKLHRIEAALPSLPPGERALQVLEHGRLLEQAEQARWNLIVQREAMGLNRHDDVDRQYPKPTRIKA